MASQLRCNGAQLEQCKEIMKSHKCPMPVSSEEALWERLREGVLVDGDKYFWLDNKARLSVELYGRALTITWGSNPEYWTYAKEPIPNTNYTVEVAKLKNVCWLDIKGEFDMRKLTVGTEYEVFFDIELTQGAQGWNYAPVTFEHNSPFGLVSKFEKKLDDIIGKGRVQVPIGMFKLPCLPIGTPCATFKMYEHGSQWKNGLIMRGVIIRPAMEVNHCN